VTTHNILTPVSHLRPDDLVDLEGDPYADAPCNEPGCTCHDIRAINHQYEYSQVDSIEQETPDCIVVHFINDDSYGFPPDHLVRRVRP
jgi:hypothetical protein